MVIIALGGGDVVRRLFCWALIGLLLSFLNVSCAEATESSWQTMRGANVTEIKEQDLADLAALGANCIRISFNRRPLISKEASNEVDDVAFAYLDQVLSWAEKYHLRVLVDPHTAPGTVKATTTSAKDPIWHDERWHETLIKQWKYIAQRYHDRGDVILGFDLLNEPNVPRLANGSPVNAPTNNWNILVAQLVKEIRQYDKTHYIFVEPITDWRVGKNRVYPLDGVNYLELPQDNKLVLSPHFYEPGAFTHQGLFWPEGTVYPGKIGDRYWDKATIREVVKPWVEFQKRTGIPIFIGEFSVPRWTGHGGNQYLHDVIDIFEENGWSWAYHVFRGADIWDAEMSNTDKNNHTRQPTTERVEILKSAFAKNAPKS